MTIKTTGSGSELRVITKDVDGQQRVSCSCCEEGCCMYAAIGLGGDYTAADLPEAITLNGVSKSKSGTGYGDTTNGVIFESGVWARYVNGARSTQKCLITGDGNLTPGDDTVEDQFEATYTLTGPDATIVVTRVSLCVWESPAVEVGSTDFQGSLTYFPTNPQEGGPSPIWSALMQDGQASRPAGGYKSSPNLSSPIGEYDDAFTPSVTVS